MLNNARLIAFYLPQFHPIPENDRWWGNGFTEWTNVRKALPLFKTHVQPRVPADLGYYDLRVPDVREAQAALAHSAGIEGFCYWHYWFAGKRLLERPFEEVVKTGRPSLPFCMAWANTSWRTMWQGTPARTLITQTYPGRADEERHFYTLLQAFADSRYITIDGRPLFIVHAPYELPQPERFCDHWNRLARKEGLAGMYFIGIRKRSSWDPRQHGFDAIIDGNPGFTLRRARFSLYSFKNMADRACLELSGKSFRDWLSLGISPDHIVSYKNYVCASSLADLLEDEYPCVLSNWDNTPRCGINGFVFHNSTPELFRYHLQESVRKLARRRPETRLVFIKSWNEWGEGNYLEPDQMFGRANLNVCREVGQATPE